MTNTSHCALHPTCIIYYVSNRARVRARFRVRGRVRVSVRVRVTVTVRVRLASYIMNIYS